MVIKIFKQADNAAYGKNEGYIMITSKEVGKERRKKSLNSAFLWPVE